MDVVSILGILVILNFLISTESFYALTLNHATMLTSLSCATNFNKLSRSQVQALAKQYKIRANQKTSEILADLNVRDF